MLIDGAKNPLMVKPFKPRDILFAFHDIDGTHSLIRRWEPVMSAVLCNTISNGLPDDFDSDQNVARLTSVARDFQNEETDRFCTESAGMSALTQMEWAIRRAVQQGTVKQQVDQALNAAIIEQMWDGQEVFDAYGESEAFLAYLAQYTPRLFRFYERVLNGACRDENLALAKQQPDRFRVPGSLEFIKLLHQNGVRNFFVTGAVVERGKGIYEEVESLGYPIGKGLLIEDIYGSTWTEKIPKQQAMNRLLQTLEGRGEQTLVIGDGRSEIAAGAQMGAVNVSRLPERATRQRELHVQLGTNVIVSDYLSPHFLQLFGAPER